MRLKKKVPCFLMNSPQQGGEGTYAYELATGLNNLNYDVFVLEYHLLKNLNSSSFDSNLIKKIKIERYDWIKKVDYGLFLGEKFYQHI